ncbi:MAG: flagellar biosynthetic protein FliQ [bacterium]|nr:flagellar biosynthetic protein FliQ [bacterium]
MALFAYAPSAIDLAREALQVALTLGGPILVVAMLSGLFVSIIQSVTQIQDPSISFGAKLASVAVALIICMPWLLDSFVGYWQQSFAGAAPTLGS